MVKYLVHCTREKYLKKILNEKIIRTGKDRGELGFGLRGKNDVVYFSFVLENKHITDPKPDKIDPRWEYCIILKIRDVVKKYKYFYMAPYWDYGEYMSKISSRLHKMVQESTNIIDLERNIINDKNISEQCKEALLDQERLEELFHFKGEKNKMILEMINKSRYYYDKEKPSFSNLEICFFENIDFSDMPYKIIKNIEPLDQSLQNLL